MFSLTKNSSFMDIGIDIYNFLSKYGFGDGRYLLDEEAEIVEALCQKTADAFGIIDGRWEPTVVETGHNPFYVAFWDRKKEEIVSYYPYNVI